MTFSAIERSAVLRWIEDPVQGVRDLFKVEPDAWQAKALRAFPKSPRLAMKSCAGPGKTFVLAQAGWNMLLTRPQPVGGATSITRDNLYANLWRELAYWHQKSPLLQKLFEVTGKAIYLKEQPETWRLEARTWAKDANPDQIGNALRGLHSDYVFWLCDESGDYPNAILPVLENIFAGNPKEAHILQAGNPSQLDGMLYRACVLARDLWYVIEITADPDDPDRTPRVSVEHAREQIRQYGRDNPWVMVNILGKFPPAAFNTLIGPDEVRAAMNRMYRHYDIEHAAKILSVDVAREGDDQSVITKRQGLQVFPFKKMRNVDGPTGAGILVREWNEWGADAAFIDMTGGFGSSWFDQAKLLGKVPIAVLYSAEAHNKDRFFNKRTEMAFDSVDWVKRGGALPDNEPRLLAAMTQTTYTFRGDRLLLEPKEMVKKRIGYSPDEWDSLMGSFAQPVSPAHQQQRQRRRFQSAMPADYDPFAGLETSVRGSYDPFDER